MMNWVVWNMWFLVTGFILWTQNLLFLFVPFSWAVVRRPGPAPPSGCLPPWVCDARTHSQSNKKTHKPEPCPRSEKATRCNSANDKKHSGRPPLCGIFLSLFREALLFVTLFLLYLLYLLLLDFYFEKSECQKSLFGSHVLLYKRISYHLLSYYTPQNGMFSFHWTLLVLCISPPFWSISNESQIQAHLFFSAALMPWLNKANEKLESGVAKRIQSVWWS